VATRQDFKIAKSALVDALVEYHDFGGIGETVLDSGEHCLVVFVDKGHTRENEEMTVPANFRGIKVIKRAKLNPSFQ
jgi:hypothetical protein